MPSLVPTGGISRTFDDCSNKTSAVVLTHFLFLISGMTQMTHDDLRIVGGGGGRVLSAQILSRGPDPDTYFEIVLMEDVVIDPYGHPRIPYRGHYDPEHCRKRREWAEKFASCSLEHTGQW